MVSLSRRFTLAFVLIVALPSLFVSVLLSRLYLSALYSTVARQTQAMAEQVAQNIESETDGVSLLASALLHDASLRSLVEDYARVRVGSASGAAHLAAAEALDAKLVSFFNYTNRIGAVALYLRRGGVYYYSNYPNIRYISGIDRSVYEGARRERGRVYLLDTLTGVAGNIGEKSMVSVAVCPDYPESTELDAILVMFRVPYFDALASRGGQAAAFDLVMYGRSGRPILSSLPARIAEEGFTSLVTSSPGPGSDDRQTRGFRTGGRSWLATVRTMDSSGWTIVLVADEAALAGSMTKYQWYLYPALVLLALLFFIYAEIFFARIAAPIRALTQGMGRVAEGDYAVRASSQGIAELSALTRGFNLMVEEIDLLLAERDRIERERLAAELEALRYQINPHFVANTLNSIRLMASAAHADAIADMSRDLMRVLSDSYAEAGQFTELSREILNVKSYVGIMKVRFGELFDVEYRLEPETESLLALRMILQPIVENSILHGFSGGQASDSREPRGPLWRGRIAISARLEEGEGSPQPQPGIDVLAGRRLVVEVRDNGGGMESGRAAELLENCAELSSLHRIGFANVQRRIRLNFGEPFGLAIESESGSYTLVRFILPALVRRVGVEGVGRA